MALSFTVQTCEMEPSWLSLSLCTHVRWKPPKLWNCLSLCTHVRWKPPKLWNCLSLHTCELGTIVELSVTVHICELGTTNTVKVSVTQPQPFKTNLVNSAANTFPMHRFHQLCLFCVLLALPLGKVKDIIPSFYRSFHK